MFDWFKNKGKDITDNVVPFPEKVPHIVPPAPVPKKQATVFYRLGVTDNNRVAFSMGMTEITMTKTGVQALIEQLQVFRDQLADDQEEE
jgi:hypothetical protein